ncbi:MAG: glycosyltransferase family 2 protein [Cytophagales bacterium]|nr:glycosyltransferase family 2 protein [Rhizobacter sp.]
MSVESNSGRLLISIVAWKGADLTIDCLRSIEPELASVPGTRVIVVDNASPDGAADRVAQAIADNHWGAWATLIRAPGNGGFAAGNNIAIREMLAEAQPAEFCLLLNPDTLVRPGALRILLDFLLAHPKVGIAGGRSEDLDATPQMCCFRFPNAVNEVLGYLGIGALDRVFHRHLTRLGIPEQPREVDWVSGAFMLIRKAVLDDIGLMDETFFLYFEETDFTRRARLAGWGCWHVPQARIVHLVGQSSGVTVRGQPRKRVPGYWFDSRRRYFVMHHGRVYTALMDLLVVLGYPIGRLMGRLRRRPSQAPHFLSDFIRHSAMFRGEGAPLVLKRSVA